MYDIEKLYLSRPELGVCRESIALALDVLTASIKNGGKILIAGNGGSAADAEHIVGELMKGFHLKRPLAAHQIELFRPALADHAEMFAANLQQGIAAVSLVSGVALPTAFANDVNASFVFAQQLFGLGRPGDVFIGISTSGNSENIVNALHVAKACGITSIGLTGQSGGKMLGLCDVTICVPAECVVDIQELHLPVYHAICAELEERFFGQSPEVCRTAVRESGVSVCSPSAPSLPSDIDLIVFDFDGVFTDNKVYTSQDGSEMVQCDRRDGLGLDLLRKEGYAMFILSTETNPVVEARAKKIGLKSVFGCGNKLNFLQTYMKEHEIDPSKTIYVGNDINDLEAMQFVGFPVAPNDAHPDILRIASLVLRADGGDGAVRELCEIILTNKG